MLNHGDDAEVQAFIDAEDEALNEEERLLMGGPDFEDAIENAFQQGLEAGHARVEIAHVSPFPKHLTAALWLPESLVLEASRSKAIQLGKGSLLKECTPQSKLNSALDGMLTFGKFKILDIVVQGDEDEDGFEDHEQWEEDEEDDEEDEENDDIEDEDGMEEAEDFVADLLPNAEQEFDMYIPNVLAHGAFGGIGGQPGLGGLQPPNQVCPL